MGKGKQRDAGLVSEMDPDAATRENSVLAADDVVSLSVFTIENVIVIDFRLAIKLLHKLCMGVFGLVDWMRP